MNILRSATYPETCGERLGDLFPGIHVQLCVEQRHPGAVVDRRRLSRPPPQPVHHLRGMGDFFWSLFTTVRGQQRRTNNSTEDGCFNLLDDLLLRRRSLA